MICSPACVVVGGIALLPRHVCGYLRRSLQFEPRPACNMHTHNSKTKQAFHLRGVFLEVCVHVCVPCLRWRQSQRHGVNCGFTGHLLQLSVSGEGNSWTSLAHCVQLMHDITLYGLATSIRVQNVPGADGYGCVPVMRYSGSLSAKTLKTERLFVTFLCFTVDILHQQWQHSGQKCTAAYWFLTLRTDFPNMTDR